ncbi:helix-turn-helix domain-containing protein [Nocardia sp. NPDC005978]|uniref:TetR/AcrR family transcriptional regulator n=1 Tax=unclassified Nocardia TaxID=2637762 RepID=UPI0033A93F6C
MPTASNTPASRVTEDDRTLILDAALRQFERVGVKKTTLEDVAREAGVDRVTVYRRIGSRDDLVQAVFNREVGLVLTDLAQIPDRHDTLDGMLVELFLGVLTHWREHPVATRMLTLEPDRVLTKLSVEGSEVFTLAVGVTAALLENAVERGLLAPADDLTTRAEIVCRLVHSLILLPRATIALDTREQIEGFARTYLLPIVAPTH